MIWGVWRFFWRPIELIKKEWQNLKNNGVSEKELKDAKSYFKGSFSRNFTSTSSIASLLNTLQYYELGIDYVKKREKIIEDVSLKDVNTVCLELFDKDELYFSVVLHLLMFSICSAIFIDTMRRLVICSSIFTSVNRHSFICCIS